MGRPDRAVNLLSSGAHLQPENPALRTDGDESWTRFSDDGGLGSRSFVYVSMADWMGTCEAAAVGPRSSEVGIVPAEHRYKMRARRDTPRELSNPLALVPEYPPLAYLRRYRGPPSTSSHFSLMDF